MNWPWTLDALVLLLGSIHFAIPLAYYAYLKRRVDRPWQLKLKPDYAPSVTVIVPTFNEAGLIKKRLENINAQDFPKDKLDVVVVDSGSTDRTAEIAENWSSRNSDLRVKLVQESGRTGKAHALNIGLTHASGEIIVLADADSFWSQDSLKEAIYPLSDESVGAVTAVKVPMTVDPAKAMKTESTYRSFYNAVRVGESKIHSTPVFHGELAAFRSRLLDEIHGFHENVGADDSHAAALLALRGFRAIASPDAVAYELTPTSWSAYFQWKKRRAKHLVQHFAILLGKLRSAPTGFRRVLGVEIFLHIVNPWFLLAACAMLLLTGVTVGYSMFHLVLLLFICIPLLKKDSREAFGAWIVEQWILAYASVARLFSTELVWPKIEELGRER